METLTEFVKKRLDNYSLNKQATIKALLFYLNSDNITAEEYFKNTLGKDINDNSAKELIDEMILNSPFGYSYKAEEPVMEQKGINNKKLVFSPRKFDIEDDEDEIYNI